MKQIGTNVEQRANDNWPPLCYPTIREPSAWMRRYIFSIERVATWIIPF